MKKALCSLAVLLFSAAIARADFMDTRENRCHSAQKQFFASQQMVKSPVPPKTPAERKYNADSKMRAFQVPSHPASKEEPFSWAKIFRRDDSGAMRPSRNKNNRAANRFGRGSTPNTYRRKNSGE